MMYLSQLILDPRSRQVQSELSNPYQMHRTIMSAFPANLPPDERVLFRLEYRQSEDSLVLLVQSHHEPDWSFLAEPEKKSYLMDRDENTGNEKNPSVKYVELKFRTGQKFVFRLRANPTVKRKYPSGDHKRVGIYDQGDQIQWLQRKAEHYGFRLIDVRITDQGHAGGWIHRERSRHHLKMVAVQFDGILQVTDPATFLQAINQGIGSGKGFGFGMLSIANPDSAT